PSGRWSRSSRSVGSGSKVVTSLNSWPSGRPGSRRRITAPLEHTAHPVRSPSSASTGTVACAERPVASTMCVPASARSCTARRTGSATCPLCCRIVPSMSSAARVCGPAARSRSATGSKLTLIAPPPPRGSCWSRAPLGLGRSRTPLGIGRPRTPLGIGRLEHFEPAEVGAQPLGNGDTPVGALVVLQDGHDPPGGGQGAVEGGHRAVAALATFAHSQPAGLEGGAVGGGGQLQVPLLSGQPRLAVELAGGAGAQVPGSGVDHPVGQIHQGEHVLLPTEELFVLGGCVLLAHVGEHLHLVELVYADDAAGVLAVGAGLAPVAGGPAGIAFRARGQVQDLP